jgi:hypothetical protein
MARPALEVADLVRAAGDGFLERNRHWLRWKHVRVLLAMAARGCGGRGPYANLRPIRICPWARTRSSEQTED